MHGAIEDQAGAGGSHSGGPWAHRGGSSAGEEHDSERACKRSLSAAVAAHIASGAAHAETPEEREAKLQRQQMLNKAAQHRYRQRRKLRQTSMESSLAQVQEQNSALQAHVMALQAALVTSHMQPQQQLLPPAMAAAVSQTPGACGAAPLQGMAPQEMLPGVSPQVLQCMPVPQGCPVVLMPSQPHPQLPMALTAPPPLEQLQQLQAVPLVAPPQDPAPPPGEQLHLAAARFPLSSGEGSGSPGQQPCHPGDPAVGGHWGPPAAGGGAAAAAAERRADEGLEAVRVFVLEHNVREVFLSGARLEQDVYNRLRSLVRAAAEGCAAALDVGAPAAAAAATRPRGDAPPGCDKQIWLQVLADTCLSDCQMRDLLGMRERLMTDLGECLAHRRAAAEQLLLATQGTACCAMLDSAGGCGPAPASPPSVEHHVAALRRDGYVGGVVPATIAVREALIMLQSCMSREGRLVREFTVAVMTTVMEPEQAAIMMTHHGRAADMLSLTNVLCELWEMVLRLNGLCHLGADGAQGGDQDVAAAVTAAAAAAAAAVLKRNGSGGAGGKGGGSSRGEVSPKSSLTGQLSASTQETRALTGPDPASPVGAAPLPQYCGGAPPPPAPAVVGGADQWGAPLGGGPLLLCRFTELDDYCGAGACGCGSPGGGCEDPCGGGAWDAGALAPRCCGPSEGGFVGAVGGCGGGADEMEEADALLSCLIPSL